MNGTTIFRHARPEDGPRLRAMHLTSLKCLGIEFYPAAVIERFLNEIGTLDDTLLEDGTYLVIESEGEFLASGGWTRQPHRLPGCDPAAPRASPDRTRATIRSVFTHPRAARRGLASTIMQTCEGKAAADGITTIDLYATLSGVPFYQRLGYQAMTSVAIPLSVGNAFGAVLMTKSIACSTTDATPEATARTVQAATTAGKARPPGTMTAAPGASHRSRHRS